MGRHAIDLRQDVRLRLWTGGAARQEGRHHQEYADVMLHANYRSFWAQRYNFRPKKANFAVDNRFTATKCAQNGTKLGVETSHIEVPGRANNSYKAVSLLHYLATFINSGVYLTRQEE